MEEVGAQSAWPGVQHARGEMTAFSSKFRLVEYLAGMETRAVPRSTPMLTCQGHAHLTNSWRTKLTARAANCHNGSTWAKLGCWWLTADCTPGA